MSINKRENMLAMLEVEMCELMSRFADASYTYNGDKMMTLFGRMCSMQKKIENLRANIGLEKREIFVTKFGDAVYSEEELKYWNELHDKAQRYNKEQKKLTRNRDQKKSHR